MDTALKAKIKKIKVLVMDVDGVLTDGRIIVDGRGQEIKNFDVQDGFGIVMFRKAGYKTAIITARSSPPTEFRAQDLKIDQVYQNAYPKLEFYKRLLVEFNVSDEEVCYIGDDLPDLKVIRQAGFAVTVPDGHDEIKRAADYVTQKSGGRGAVREVVELILKAQGRWEDVLAGQ